MHHMLSNFPRMQTCVCKPPYVNQSARAVDIGIMWRYCRDFSAHEDLRPLSETVYQGPTFREWANANKEALVAALNK